jgi:hypothetical protein
MPGSRRKNGRTEHALTCSRPANLHWQRRKIATRGETIVYVSEGRATVKHRGSLLMVP